METHAERGVLFRRIAAASLAIAAALVLPLRAAGQASGGEVLRTALDRHEARLEGVETVTIVQETTTPIGTSTRQEVRLVKATRDGHTLLLPKGENAAADVMPMSRIVASFDSVSDRAVLRGRSEVDGHEVYVVAVPGLRGVDFGQESLPGRAGRSFRADSATFYVDADRYVLRRAEVYGRTSMGGSERSVHVDAHLSDYRETEGYLHPYRAEIRIDVRGMEKQMRAMMQKMQQAGADSARQAMMERAMGALMGGEMKVTVRVEELRVNEPDAPR